MTEIQKEFGIVLMIDALGISGFTSDQCIKFLEKRGSLNTDLKLIKGMYEFVFGKVYSEKIHVSEFGDTIIICWQHDDINSKYFKLFQVVSDTNHIIKWGTDNGILFRGCISVGEYIYENNPLGPTFIGPAIFDAHDWYESTNWFGVIFSPKAKLWVDSVIEGEMRNPKYNTGKMSLKNLQRELVLYDAPLSHSPTGENTKKFLTIAWPYKYFSNPKRLQETPRESLSNDLFKIPQSKVGEPKFKHSLDFFDWYSENHPYNPDMESEKLQ